MILIIAEKPSVGRDIARVVGATTKGDGYLQGNGYLVTWCFGHLIQLAMPKEYGYAWGKESLPMLPKDFKLVPLYYFQSKFLKYALFRSKIRFNI